MTEQIRDVARAPMVSVVGCETYGAEAVERALTALLAPLGGMARFVHPGMQVLLKPNMLSASALDRAVTTHPAVIQALAKQVQSAGGTVWIGDSPAGPLEGNAPVWKQTGMAAIAAADDAIRMTPFDRVTWKRLAGKDYFIAPPVLEADLVINVPKLKTHGLTLYTGAVKNMFGAIPGARKRELHTRALGMQDFSEVLVDVLELARPGLTIMDGIMGQEGMGPGAGGTPHRYGCLAASTDPVALDAVMTRAMGYRTGEVLHLARAGARSLGICDPDTVRIDGDRRVLGFGPLRLPRTRGYLRIPSWVSVPMRGLLQARPRVVPSLCIGCGRCATVCPRDVITPGRPPVFSLDRCIGCLCCAEICPEGAIDARRRPLARLFSVGP
jgi:uncharacterized protein (DUF362 family)/NAD-dependent dihydropyrimidine dehydrogenase PreA subunit